MSLRLIRKREPDGDHMNNQREPISINSSAIAVAGLGGLGMIALVVIIAATFAIARWLLLGGVAGGVILAAILILRRRHRQLGGPRGDLPIVLFSTGYQVRDAKLDAIDENRRRIEQEPRRRLAARRTWTRAAEQAPSSAGSAQAAVA